MSKLKDQLKVILPTLSEEANHNRDPEVKFRLYALKYVVDSKKDVKTACESKGVSTDFFYEWGGRLLRVKKALKPGESFEKAQAQSKTDAKAY